MKYRITLNLITDKPRKLESIREAVRIATENANRQGALRLEVLSVEETEDETEVPLL